MIETLKPLVSTLRRVESSLDAQNGCLWSNPWLIVQTGQDMAVGSSFPRRLAKPSCLIYEEEKSA